MHGYLQACDNINCNSLYTCWLLLLQLCCLLILYIRLSRSSKLTIVQYWYFNMISYDYIMTRHSTLMAYLLLAIKLLVKGISLFAPIMIFCAQL